MFNNNKNDTHLFRRYFKNTSNFILPAGTEKKIIEIKDKGYIRLLTLFFNGNDSTGSFFSRVNLIIDGRSVFSDTIVNLYTTFGCSINLAGRTDFFTFVNFNTTYKLYTFSMHNLGPVKNNLQLLCYNADLTNSAEINSGLIYDVI